MAMEYHDSPERSTELLRQALPLMSRQAAALHPVSYAVWYAYVRQPSSPLRQEVDEVIAAQGTLDERATQAIFSRHLADREASTAQKLADGLQQVLGGMSAQAAQAQDEASRYGDTLQRAAQNLAVGANGFSGQVLEELMSGTSQMHGQMGALHQKLAESRREIATLQQEVQRARAESLVDALTMMANRRAFDQRLAEWMAQPPQRPPLSMLMCDLDHFKRINDTYGHGFGDQVLKVVSQVLRKLSPEDGLVARVGGEEFAVLLPALALADAAALAERLRAAVASARIRRKHSEEAVERITVSIGVAQHRAEEDADAFIDRADRLLYTAKAEGRDRVTVEG